jgi:hypothetical protein
MKTSIIITALMTVFLFGMIVGILGVSTVWIPGKGIIASSSDSYACLKAVELALDKK